MTPPSKPIRILYAEDDPATARLLEKRLKKIGYAVDIAPNGEEGLTMWDRGSYDLLIVDHEMPKKTGIEVIQSLASRGPLPPIIMVTGMGNEDVAVEAMKLGISDYVVKDGQGRYRELISAKIKDALNKQRYLEEKQRAEEALQQAHDELEHRVEERTADLTAANEFLDTVLESLTHPFYVINANDYSITMANSAAGFADSEPESTCYALTHGLDEPCTFPDHTCPLDELKQGKKPVTLEHIHYDKNGNARVVEVHAFPIFDRDGNVIQVIEYNLDITDRREAERAHRESEERFRAIFESAQDCIYLKDRSLRYTLANPYMTSLLGLEASEIIDRTDDDLFGPLAGKIISEQEYRVLKGETRQLKQTRKVRGEDVTFLDIKVPLRDSRGNIIGTCGISRDISDRSILPRPSDPTTREKYPSAAMRSTLEQALQVTSTDTTVLLTGESGCGKDYLARFIHDHSRRANGPYYAINCAAVPHDLAEAELFGHAPGAFTGASRQPKKGQLELAEGGTLLLNEIGELPLPLQAKLLTFLDTKEFTPVGGVKSRKVNARLIAATNRDLQEEVSSGRFRSDLFHRLNVFSITVPPLRERIKDIPILVTEIISELEADLQLPPGREIDAETMSALKQYRWPGNVRELRNVLERGLILSQGGPLTEQYLQLTGDGDWSLTVGFPKDQSLDDLFSDLKRSLFEEALRRSRGKKVEAARLLGISRFVFTRHLKGLDSSEAE